MDNQIEISHDHLVQALQAQLAEAVQAVSQYRAAVIALQEQIKALSDSE